MATRTYQQALGSATPVTNASSSVWVDQVTASFSLDASSTYLILGYCEGQVNNTTAADGQYRLFDGTTALCSSNFRHVSSDASEWVPINLVALITTTGAATPTLALQAKLSGTAASRIVSTRNGVIFALKLGANDASFSNDVAGTSASNPGTWTDYNPASGTKVLTFTPPSTGDYLIIATAIQQYSSAADGSIVALLLEDGTTRAMTSNWVPINSGNKMSYAATVRRTGLTAVAQSFKLQHSRQRSATGTSTLDQVRMVALRLADFDASSHTEDLTTRTTTSATYVDLGTTQTDTLTNAIDYLLLGSWWEGTNNNAILHSSKLTDGTTAYNESQRKENYHAAEPNWGQAIVVPRVLTGTGASLTHKVQGKITSVLTLTETEKRLHLLQLQASGITPTPITASDSATLTDATTVLTAAGAMADLGTLTDVTTAFDRTGSSDSATMTDTGGAIDLAPVAAETATLTDVTSALAAAGSMVDAGTLTDATTAFDRPSSDTATLTDLTTGLDRPSSDSATLTDVTSGLAATGLAVDAGTLTDLTTGLGAAGSLTDSATLTDVSTALAAALTAADAGTEDDTSALSTAPAAGGVAQVAVSASDAFALAEASTVAATLGAADTVALTDATPALTVPFVSSDAASLTDASTAAPAISGSDAVSCVETVGMTVDGRTADAAVLGEMGAVSATFGAADAAFMAELDVLTAVLGVNDAAVLADVSAAPASVPALAGWPTGRTWGPTIATAGTGDAAGRDGGTSVVGARDAGAGNVAGSGGSGQAADRGAGTSAVGPPT